MTRLDGKQVQVRQDGLFHTPIWDGTFGPDGLLDRCPYCASIQAEGRWTYDWPETGTDGWTHFDVCDYWKGESSVLRCEEHGPVY